MISIIIPTLNEEKTIEGTLKWLINLSIPHEIIVTDGGSADSTVAIAKRYPVTVVEYPKDKYQNISLNKNHGAGFAHGKFLVFLDCGSVIFHPSDFFSRAMEHFTANPRLVGLTVSFKVFPEVATLMDKIVFSTMNFILMIINNILHRGAAQGKFQMVRADAFVKISGFRADLPASEDMDLFFRLSRIGRTMIDRDLELYHASRRAHAIGWPKLLYIWNRDALSLFFRNKVVSKEWKPIR